MMIGITGGSGAGKTTALNVLREMGFTIIDCDAVYHGLLSSDDAMKAELKSSFPEAFSRGKLNRKKLGKTVFSDPGKLDRLNGIIFKYVIARVTEIASGTENSAVDAISLVESGLHLKCDFTVAVIAPREERVRRIMLRDGVSREYAELRISAQKPDSFYEENCDFIITNDGNEESFRQKCEMLFKDITGGQS
ncbi:MAG: dephospho-CoA kinase [Oscillospiraceae bacterium]|nr:dephospho-CoA kinase [Oscillospiraceae bacterium]